MSIKWAFNVLKLDISCCSDNLTLCVQYLGVGDRHREKGSETYKMVQSFKQQTENDYQNFEEFLKQYYNNIWSFGLQIKYEKLKIENTWIVNLQKNLIHFNIHKLFCPIFIHLKEMAS